MNKSHITRVLPGGDDWSVDAVEQILIESEREIARLRATQIAALQLIDHGQVATADGARTLSEWVARRLDIDLPSARSLVRTMRRTEMNLQLREALAEGKATFDRVEAASKVNDPGPDPLLSHLDISGVYREAARQARINARTEEKSFLDQHLILQPSLDQSWWKIWGGLDGHAGAVVDKALTTLIEQFPKVDGLPTDPALLRAIALTELCIDEEPPPAQVSIFIDTDTALPSNGQAGVYLEAGPRVGRAALEAILCDSVHEVTISTKDGTLMKYGRRSRSIPPALRKAVIRRDGNRCAIAGCNSRHRLQVHHIISWSEGGLTDPDNLITVCWHHHHVAIHRLGLTPYRHPDHGQIWLRQKYRAPPG